MSDPDHMMKMLSDIRKDQLDSYWSTLFKDKLMGLVSVNIAILGWMMSLISSSPSMCVLIAAWLILILDSLTLLSFWKAGSKSQEVAITKIVAMESVKYEDQSIEENTKKILRDAQEKQEQEEEKLIFWSRILFSITVGLCLGLLVYLSIF